VEVVGSESRRLIDLTPLERFHSIVFLQSLSEQQAKKWLQLELFGLSLGRRLVEGRVLQDKASMTGRRETGSDGIGRHG